MITYNGSILAAVDIETTGLTPGYNEVVQLCILPLGPNLDPNGHPFYTNIRPEHPERHCDDAKRTHGIGDADLRLAPDRTSVEDSLISWKESLGLPNRRRVIPVCHNALFDIPFLKGWLGHEFYHEIFHFLHRDTMQMGLTLNDMAAYKCQKCPFSSVALKSMCTRLGVPLHEHHDALADCVATAKLYREILRMSS
jgi:DNA polymerase III epsilon subunit-like protein